MKCAGLDIGGANIKFASTEGAIEQVSFRFWKNKDLLPEVLRQFMPLISAGDLLGVTMTAELADCFEDKKSGVEFIVESVESVFAPHHPLYYRTDGGMCEAKIAMKDWPLVAASNWHATAWLAFADSKEKSGYVFDIGSTTTDIVPVQFGLPVVKEQDDLARLSNGQLYYGGVGRTPLCGLLDRIKLDSGTIATANEVFATTRDSFVWLNELPADEKDLDSADGRSNSRSNAGKRLARMVCSDLNSMDHSLVDLIASQARQQLVAAITGSLRQVVAANPEVALSFVTFGEGAWLAEEIVNDAFGFGATEGHSVGKPNPAVRPFSDDVLVNQTAPALAVAKKRLQLYAQTVASQ